MAKKSEARNQILLAHADNLITDEEFVLLYDMNRSKNLELPYRNYLNFDLDAMSDDECWSEFRFYKGDIFRLIDVLHLPDHFTCYNGSVFEREEAMCIFLKRFAYPCRYQDLIFRFARAPPLLCMVSNQVMNFLYENWNYKLSGMNRNWLSPQKLQEYADIIHAQGAPLDNCWGFIDGTVRPLCRPGENQRILYNGHKRIHAIKFQSVVAPNGLIANMYGPVEGKRHDSGMLAASGLLFKLQQSSFGLNGNALCICGDPAYPLRLHLQTGFRGAQLTQQHMLWNKHMSEVRVNVEWIFKDFTYKLDSEVHNLHNNICCGISI